MLPLSTKMMLSSLHILFPSLNFLHLDLARRLRVEIKVLEVDRKKTVSKAKYNELKSREKKMNEGDRRGPSVSVYNAVFK